MCGLPPTLPWLLSFVFHVALLCKFQGDQEIQTFWVPFWWDLHIPLQSLSPLCADSICWEATCASHKEPCPSVVVWMNLPSPPHTKQPLICLNPPYMFEYFVPTWKYLEKGRRCSLAEGMCVTGVSFGISEDSSYSQCVFSLFLPVQQDAISQGLFLTLYSCSSNTYLWKP